VIDYLVVPSGFPVFSRWKDGTGFSPCRAK